MTPARLQVELRISDEGDATPRVGITEKIECTFEDGTWTATGEATLYSGKSEHLYGAILSYLRLRLTGGEEQ